jgi:hypothetical protein
VPAGRRPFQPHDDHLLDEGDILSEVPFIKWEDGEATVGGGARGLVTSNGCACEDYDRALAAGRGQAAAKVMIQVAPLRPAASYPSHRLDEIASGQQLDFFLVHGKAGVLPDHVVDLTREQPVPASVLAGCPKIARLAAWQWKALLIHIAVSRFHQKPEDLFRADLLEEAR